MENTSPVSEKIDIKEIIAENARRNAALQSLAAYDPLTGEGACGDRRLHEVPFGDGHIENIPAAMIDDPQFAVANSLSAWQTLRCRHDFEYWAVRCATIRDKSSGRDIPFRLNAPQRRVLAQLERMRLADKPLRLIMLKARQWGGSTLIQIYMAWIQICLRRNWNSLICAHVKDTAATIRGMYSLMLANYPKECWQEETAPQFRPFERSVNIRVIDGRGCKVTIASAESQDAVRGMDIAMAHLSEVAFWRNSPQQNPEGFIRAVCGAINAQPLTLIALESTANGTGNYFHTEWLRAVAGESDKEAVFVPWHEIEIYRLPVADAQALLESMDSYEWNLWHRGLTLEMIAWYHAKRREYSSRFQMMAEYPSTPEEAFASTDRAVFPSEHIARLRQGCRPPSAQGDIVAAGGRITGPESLRCLSFASTPGRGALEIWQMPCKAHNYLAAVDIGGRSEKSDWSVVAVLDLDGDGGPEVVAQWRGHLDHDILAWHAARIGLFYNSALLVFEANTLETELIEGDPAEFILNQLAWHYPNLYRRAGGAPGFHTNRATKTAAVATLMAALRDGSYTERSHSAADELAIYQTTPAGGFSAPPGKHDDMVMARAIALHVAAETSDRTHGAHDAADFLRRKNFNF